MGEDFLREHAKQFKYQRDRAFERELKQSTLFHVQPDVLNTEFPCRLTVEGIELKTGDKLLTLNAASNTVDILRGNEAIAEVALNGGSNPFHAMTTAACGIASIIVREPPGLGGYFTAAIAEEADE